MKAFKISQVFNGVPKWRIFAQFGHTEFVDLILKRSYKTVSIQNGLLKALEWPQPMCVNNLVERLRIVVCISFLLHTQQPFFVENWASAIDHQNQIIFKNGPFPASVILIFVFSIHLSVNVQYKLIPMIGFKPRTSGVGSDRCTNWIIELL